jgi:hypothetical protein
MFNPRFPHTLRVWRVREDEYGEPVTDDEGNAAYDIVSLDVAVTVDNRPLMGLDGSVETEVAESICFGYRTQGKNTRETVDVVVSDFKLATPMFLTPLKPGDRVEITDYERTYWGEVVKKMTFNLGSNIWVNEIKN